MRNLISKRTGIDDHFAVYRHDKIVFKDNHIYTDIVKNEDLINNEPAKYGDCMKNVYRSDEWLKAWIKCEANKTIGKDNAYYVYNVDYDGIQKPTKKHLENNDDDDDLELYERANGVMYYDFDHIGKDIVQIIKESFIKISSEHKALQWFETSWSGNGCHIRLNYNLTLNHRSEWQFVYMFYLDALMKEISNHTDTSTWYTDGTIDWSCATITRGFAIPYNENGVIENHDYDRNHTIGYKNKEEFITLVGIYVYGWFEKPIADKFLHNVGIKKYNKTNNNRFVNVYNVDAINPENAEFVDGEKFNYNWRLKCVTTLMNIYNGDKDKVREACKYIYSLIKPYKNHTYKEMINDELENKIFRNADFSVGTFNSIIEDLKIYFGFNISSTIKVNDVYVSEILNEINISKQKNDTE